jgi:3-hydroxyisobutyrate dehydrogenase-like beta-hydroxyacid dehydrogenase
MAEKIGVIGVGLMGHGIGANLMAKGYDLVVMAHRKRELVDDLVSKGAVEAASPRAVAEACDIVLLCVTGSPQVEAVMFGPVGVIAGARAGMLVIDCSTGEPGLVERVSGELQAKGVAFADAPLARTPVEAAAGKLNTMVGADAATFARARPVLEAFCENIFHIGAVGSGARMKLINNLVAMGQAALFAEGMVAARATGVDLRQFYEVLSKGGANSGIFQMMVPAILDEGSFEGMKFSLKNAAKDLGYFGAMAEAAGIEHPLGREVHAVLLKAVEACPDGLVPGLVQAGAARNGVTIGKT